MQSCGQTGCENTKKNEITSPLPPSKGELKKKPLQRNFVEKPLDKLNLQDFLFPKPGA
jgi:hypothetical protein